MYCPEHYGPIGTGADGRAINAAVAAAQAAGGGMVVLSQPYAIETTISVRTGPAVNFWCLGAGNRQVNPDTATGGSVRPADGFPPGSPLFAIGTRSERYANPCGTTFLMPRITGRSPRGVPVEGCTGILVTDTADVHLVEPFLAEFDRRGGSGTAVHLAGSERMAGAGFCVTGGIISSSWRGIYGDGPGVTDLRLAGLLEHSNTCGVTLGATAGGGGLQMSGCHLVYANGPRGGWRLALGPAAGDFIVTGNYFDKNGPSPAIVLASGRGKVSENHFLADASCDGPMVTVTAAAVAELPRQRMPGQRIGHDRAAAVRRRGRGAAGEWRLRGQQRLRRASWPDRTADRPPRRAGQAREHGRHLHRRERGRRLSPRLAHAWALAGSRGA